jgi:hypothetical protein
MYFDTSAKFQKSMQEDSLGARVVKICQYFDRLTDFTNANQEKEL